MQSEENKKNFRKFGLNNHSLRPADRWRLILSSSVTERKANEDSFDNVENILIIKHTLSELKNQPLSELMSVLSIIAEQNNLDLVITYGGI